ncbi:MAG: T9SS type A sorting domain-containing protein, partial [Bacteroidota bacterium]
PNPSSGIVNISVEEKNSSAYIKLFLYDKLGKKVLEKNLTYANLQSIDLSMLKQGTYLLIVQTENNQEKFEIIKTL